MAKSSIREYVDFFTFKTGIDYDSLTKMQQKRIKNLLLIIKNKYYCIDKNRLVVK